MLPNPGIRDEIATWRDLRIQASETRRACGLVLGPDAGCSSRPGKPSQARGVRHPGNRPAHIRPLAWASGHEPQEGHPTCFVARHQQPGAPCHKPSVVSMSQLPTSPQCSWTKSTLSPPGTTVPTSPTHHPFCCFPLPMPSTPLILNLAEPSSPKTPSPYPGCWP